MTDFALQKYDGDVFMDVQRFEHAQRVAKVFASADMIPQHFRNNIGNIMIAMNYASRIGADFFMTMQCMYVIAGKPGIEGKLVASLINSSGKYKSPLRYRWVGANDVECPKAEVVNKSDKDHRGCIAYTIAEDGKEISGPKIDWHLVHSEGWYGKNQSKWKTIPEIMFMYRSASWFANVHCPEVKLGMATVEELRDMDAVDLSQNENGAYEAKETVVDKLNDLAKTPTEESPPPELKDTGSAPGDVNSEEIVEAITWCPYDSEIQGRYSAEKVKIIEAEIRKFGLEPYKNATGATKHQQLLKLQAEQQEEEALGAPPEFDPPPQGKSQKWVKLFDAINQHYSDDEISMCLQEMKMANRLEALGDEAIERVYNKLVEG